MRNIEATAASARPNRRSPWPWFIVALLGSHVLAMVVAVTIAVRDRSFAVVPNYYQRAVNWDEEQAKFRASEMLGWRVAVETSGHVDPFGRRAVSFVLSDAQGHAIPGATLQVEYFHEAHGDEDHDVKLTPDAADPTRFTCLLPMRYAGEWEFHFTANAGNQSFVAKQTQTVSNASGPDRRPA